MTTGRRPLEELADRLGADWQTIRRASEESRRRLEKIEGIVEAATNQDVSFVVFGSLARLEHTQGSDLDWTLLVDGLSDPAHFDAALSVERRLAEHDIKPPGREGTFGGLAASHPLIHNIGGEDDTNRNTTQRVLLLLESAALGDHGAYQRVRRNVLSRYISEDWGWAHGRTPAEVPRFLQNDLARYWRTVAVDFAYKRRARAGKGWALRTVKLRLSRKMTYAAGLLACFSCDLEGVVADAQRTDELHGGLVIDHLEKRFSLPPLDILATTVLGQAELDGPAHTIFSAYDEFLALIDDPKRRKQLEDLTSDEAEGDAVYQDARAISHRFQEGLNRIFFENETRIPELTRIYGVF